MRRRYLFWTIVFFCVSKHWTYVYGRGIGGITCQVVNPDTAQTGVSWSMYTEKPPAEDYVHSLDMYIAPPRCQRVTSLYKEGKNNITIQWETPHSLSVRGFDINIGDGGLDMIAARQYTVLLNQNDTCKLQEIENTTFQLNCAYSGRSTALDIWIYSLPSPISMEDRFSTPPIKVPLTKGNTTILQNGTCEKTVTKQFLHEQFEKKCRQGIVSDNQIKKQNKEEGTKYQSAYTFGLIVVCTVCLTSCVIAGIIYRKRQAFPFCFSRDTNEELNNDHAVLNNEDRNLIMTTEDARNTNNSCHVLSDCNGSVNNQCQSCISNTIICTQCNRNAFNQHIGDQPHQHIGNGAIPRVEGYLSSIEHVSERISSESKTRIPQRCIYNNSNTPYNYVPWDVSGSNTSIDTDDLAREMLNINDFELPLNDLNKE